MRTPRPEMTRTPLPKPMAIQVVDTAMFERLSLSKQECLGGELEFGQIMGRDWVRDRADYALLTAFLRRDEVDLKGTDSTMSVVQIIGTKIVIMLGKMYSDWRSRDEVLVNMFREGYRDTSATFVRGFIQGAEVAYREIEESLKAVEVYE